MKLGSLVEDYSRWNTLSNSGFVGMNDRALSSKIILQKTDKDLMSRK